MTQLEAVDLDLNHVRVIVCGMVQVAKSDGAHERELVLIREFYESCREQVAGLTEFGQLANAKFDAADAREVLDTDALRRTFLMSCYLVAYADGKLSDPEQRAIAALVKDLGIAQPIADQARELAKDQLLMQLASSDNLEALTQIAGKL